MMAASVVHRSAPHVALRDTSLLLAAVAGLGIYVRHAAGYFFLFDDYALLHEASRLPAADILRAPLFDFYRPAAFLLTRAEFALAGWSMPALYAGTNLLIHFANTGLVYVLASRLAPRDEPRAAGAAIAALLFGLAPWALEAPFWVSGRFDVLSTFGVLVALVCGTAFCQTTQGIGRWIAAVTGVAGFSFGLFAKEMAVTAPLLFMMVMFALPTDSGRSWRWSRTTAFTTGLAVIVVAYLLIRQQIVPGLNGTYGPLSDLLGQAPLSDNLYKFMTALVRFAATAPPLAGKAASVVLTIGSLWALAKVMSHPRLLVLCLSGFMVSLLPVAWAGIAPSGSGGGRFLYLPGVWFALMLGLGLTRGAVQPIMAAADCVLAVVMVLLMTASVYLQSQVWSTAIHIARRSIFQLGEHAGTDRPLFVPNLPFWYDEGPYVLKSYAFDYYEYGAKMPPVNARPFSLKMVNGRPHFAAWADQYGIATPPPGTRVVALNLPVEGLILAPLTPQNLKGAVNQRQVVLTWDQPELTNAVPERIVIEAGLTPAFTQSVATYVLPGLATEHTVNDVAPNTYYARIRAENGSGVSAISPEMVVKVQ